MAASNPRPGDDVTFAAILAAERDLTAYEATDDGEARDRFLTVADRLPDLLARWIDGRDDIALPDDVKRAAQRVFTARHQLRGGDADKLAVTARRVRDLEAQVEVLHQFVLATPALDSSPLPGATLARAASAVIDRGLPLVSTDDPALPHLAAAAYELSLADTPESRRRPASPAT